MSLVEHKLFVCTCNDLRHQLIFSRFTSPEYVDEDVYITVGLIEDLPFFKRFWFALLYLFKIRNDPYQFDIGLSSNDVKELAEKLLENVK